MVRIREIISLGTGAVETNSGYGLTTADELKMLRVIKRIKDTTALEVWAIFLGAHANELDFPGGVQTGVKYGALSVDHLERSGEQEIAVLSGTGTMPTLLPGSALFLGLPEPLARKMVDSGLAVALALALALASGGNGNLKREKNHLILC